MIVLYNIGIAIYSAAIIVAAFFNPKAKLLHLGRKNTWHILSQFKTKAHKQLAWFHCASLGEFEQARPLIESLKAEHDMQIAVSFFSPSGYEIRKNYALADIIFYLPSDSSNHAQKVIDALKPNYIFFVKYEIWLHYIDTIFKLGIPIYLLSATFRPGHIYFKWYGNIFKNALSKFTLIFTQDKQSTQLLQANGFSNVLFSNDTRFDRVFNTCQNPKKLPLVSAFKQHKQLLVLGSSYNAEEQITAKYLKQNPHLKVVVAPHHINTTRIQQVLQTFKAFNPVLYSQINNADLTDMQVLIIDNIGLLASIYQYADLAFIGGGFGKSGIHNTLEAATFGMPIFIGPNNHHKFHEVEQLKKERIVLTVHHYNDFLKHMNTFIENKALLKTVKNASQQFIKNNIGATKIVLEQLT